MSTNLARSRRAGRCLDHYRFLAGDLSREECVTDLVADIGHYCVENDLTYLWLPARGISHWRLEMTDPESVRPLPKVTIHIQESKSHE
ncbi:MAG: hypothetical protein AB7O57_16945 [Hyphomicrobiaceae bacterium]